MKKQAYNPYLPGWEYIPDGEPHIFGDRVYIYGSHDRFDGGGFCLNDYVCWSAPTDSLGDWRYEGVLYRRDQDPMNADGSQYLFAPDVQQGPDGRYYLFYCLNESNYTGVAVCDTPAGEYSFYGNIRFPDGRLSGGSGDCTYQFDPGVLVDDDGRVYLYYGFAPTHELRQMAVKFDCHMDGGYFVELEPDMLTIKRGPELLFPGIYKARGTAYEAHPFFEASSMRKVGERYYFVYSSVNMHELCYAVSDRPDGGFTFGGTLVSIGDVYLEGRKPEEALNYLGNTHGSLLEIGWQWYVFYHRQTNCHSFSRQACAEPVTLLPDGRILQAEITSCGLNGGPLRGQGEYEARIACNLRSKDGAGFHNGPKGAGGHPYFTQDEPDGDSGRQYIANLQDGALAGFKYFEFDGASAVSVTIRGTARGSIFVSADPEGQPPAAEIQVMPSESWRIYRAPLHMADGKQPLYFMFQVNMAALVEQ